MNILSGEILRILLVSTHEARRDEVGEALMSGAGEHRLYWISDADSAPLRVLDLAPHVILVDDDPQEGGALTLIASLTARAPQSLILALVEAQDLARARQAIVAGARGFIEKPCRAEELIPTLRQLLSRQSARGPADENESEPGQVIVYCAPKGGTGRTTLTINSSICLREMIGSPLALVDADYAAPALDVALNLHAEHTVADLLPRLARLDEEIIRQVLAGHASGLQVLLAPPPALLESPMSLPQVQQVLGKLKRMFPLVVVDLGLPMDETAFAFLGVADLIVMSVLPEMVGLRNTGMMLDQLRERGHPDERVWVVLNRATMAGGISVPEIEERLQIRVRFCIPDDQPLATHTINRGVPFMLSHPRSGLARAVRQFAGELLHHLAPPDPVTPNGHGATGDGWLGRLNRRFRPGRPLHNGGQAR